MKKPLYLILAIVLLLCLNACQAQPPAEPQPQPEQPVEETPPAEPQGPALAQVNIYHLGIMTPLDIQEVQVAELAAQLQTLLENAAAQDSMEAAPEDAMNPIQAMARQTSLEVIYAQPIELPFAEGGEPLGPDDEPLTAQRLLYAIPVSSSEGGLLFIGQDIFTEAPLGRLFDQTYQDSIYNSACDQVERVVFSADGARVMINNEEYAYSSGEGAAELSGRVLNRMLYRSIAFYLSSYVSNLNGLEAVSTEALFNAIQLAKDTPPPQAQPVLEEQPAGEEATGEEAEQAPVPADLGAHIIANLNQYVLAEFFLPETILAPVAQGESGNQYLVTFRLNDRAAVNFHFIVEEDTPLVSALELVLTD